jgi:glycine dehydrogenase subunit 1
MRYLPKSPDERKQMLAAIGISSIDELFAPIPERFRLQRDLRIPPQMAESEKTPPGNRSCSALAPTITTGLS